MNLLVIDTATEACSVALSANGNLISRFEICPQQHSQRLLPMIDEVIAEAGTTIGELDYLGFGRGPGSFTGVRIATGMLQGLALGTGAKVVGVSTLAAMAQQVGCELTDDAQVAVAIDARMDEVYFAQYQISNGIAELVGEEAVLPPEQAKAVLAKGTDCFAGTGWAAYPSLHDEAARLADILYPNAEFMLPLAKQLISQGQAKDVEEIQPVYLRDKVTWKKLPGRE